MESLALTNEERRGLALRYVLRYVEHRPRARGSGPMPFCPHCVGLYALGDLTPDDATAELMDAVLAGYPVPTP